MRYTRQHNTYGCGPIALLNALKWAGYQVSKREHFKELCEMVSCETTGMGSGTDPLDLFYGLVQLDELVVKKVLHVPRLKEIDDELDKGRVIIIRYFHAQGGHYCLIIGRTEKYYIVVNDHQKKTVMKRSRKTMRKMIRERRIYPGVHKFCVAWSIEERQ